MSDEENYANRRWRLLDLLASYGGPVTCRELAEAFGAEVPEVRSKLISLRTCGHVNYDTGHWSVAGRTVPGARP